MKKLIFAVVVACSLPSAVMASENCKGKVTEIMGHPNVELCNGRLAFRLDVTGNTYLCSLTEQTDSMLLLAYGGKRSVIARLDLPQAGVCTSLATQYVKPYYLQLRD